MVMIVTMDNHHQDDLDDKPCCKVSKSPICTAFELGLATTLRSAIWTIAARIRYIVSTFWNRNNYITWWTECRRNETETKEGKKEQDDDGKEEEDGDKKEEDDEEKEMKSWMNQDWLE